MAKSSTGRRVLDLLSFLLFAYSMSAYPVYADVGQPNVMMGKKIFMKYCAGCHGSLGQGDGYRILGPAPADFTSLLSKEKSDEDLLKTIHEGKPNMPAWQYRLSQQDGQNVLEYIRALQQTSQ